MILIIYITAIVICIGLIIWIIALILPKQRIKVCKSVYNTSSEKVFNIITNNNDWQYRSDLKELKILEKNDDFETWDEIAKNGNIIHFKTRKKIPFSYYAFDMESKIMKGFWEAEIKELDNGKTLFIATEYIKMKNLFLNVFSYLFFNIGRYMEKYQKDLGKKIELG